MRRALALLFTAAPFVAGAVPFLSARRDLRMLFMAAVATIVVRLVASATPPGHAGVGGSVGFVLATMAAAAVAVAFGAHAVFGVGAVAIVLAGCAAVGAILAPRAGIDWTKVNGEV